jgi:hypothetical protein
MRYSIFLGSIEGEREHTKSRLAGDICLPIESRGYELVVQEKLLVLELWFSMYNQRNTAT